MRTIKFLFFSVLLFTAAPAFAQGGIQPGAFPRIDRFARIEARRIERRQHMRQVSAKRLARMRIAGRVGLRAGAQAGFRAAGRPGFRAGTRAGWRAGARAGFRAGRNRGLHANATPEMRAFREQLLAQRQAMRAQVKDGKLTREQAHTQMRSWITEHRPNK
jgi:hypothetical protein